MIIKKEFPEGYIVYDRPKISKGLLFLEELGLTNLENIKGNESKIFVKFIEKFPEYIKELSFKGKTTFDEMEDDYSSIPILQDILKEFCESMAPTTEKKI